MTQNINLNPLASNQGITINGYSDDQSGVVSGAGDVNGDGFADFIIGAPNTSGGGEVFVIYGGISLPSVINLQALMPSQGFFIYGAPSGSFLGLAVGSAGDINNDGYDDVIVGAPDTSDADNSDVGIAYIVYGGPSVPFEINLANLGTLGITIFGEYGGGKFGNSVNTAGDINKDGFDDIVIGTQWTNYVYVIYGGNSLPSTINTSSLGIKGIYIIGTTTNEGGYSVASAGDINKDGYDDIIIGATQAYILYGSSSLPSSIVM